MDYTPLSSFASNVSKFTYIMRKFTMTLVLMATVATTITSCDAIERCCGGGKSCTKETQEAKASEVCKHCGKTSCTASCTAHVQKDSTMTGR